MKKTTLSYLICAALLTPAISHAQFGNLLKNLPGGLPAGLPGGNQEQGKAGDKAKAEPAPAKGLGALGGLIGMATSSQGENDEIEIGQGVAATILGAAKLSSEEKTQRYVNLVGQHIAQHSERKDLPWAFGIVETPSINAFAAPGGYILVTSGLYALLESEDELAAVLAHEIVHVNKKHHYNVIQKQKMVEFGTKFVGSQIGKDDKTGMAKRLVGMGGELIARGLDKDAEYEADRDGVVLAARAGYDASAMISVLSKLQAKAKGDESMKLFTATHPTAADRIQALSSLINDEIESFAVPSPAAARIRTATK